MYAEGQRQRKALLKSKNIKSRLDSLALGRVIKVAEQLPTAIKLSPVKAGGKELIPVNILDEY